MSGGWSEIEAVSFDVGGTLVPEQGGPVTAEIAALLGVDIPAMRGTLSLKAKRTRTAPRVLARELATEAEQPDLAGELEALLQRRRDLAAQTVPYADVASTIATLRERGFRIVFLSNVVGAAAPKPDHFLLRLADVALSSCDTGHIKPEREAFADAERALGVLPARMAHVGGTQSEQMFTARWRLAGKQCT